MVSAHTHPGLTSAPRSSAGPLPGIDATITLPPHTLSHTYTHAHAHTWEVDLSLESREREREKKKGKERGSAASAIRASGQSRQRVCVEETSSEQPAAHLGIVHVQFVIWQVSRFASDALCVTGYLFICRWSAPAPRRAWIAQARTRRLHRWLPVCVCRLCGTPNRKKPQLGCTHTLTHTHAEAFFSLSPLASMRRVRLQQVARAVSGSGDIAARVN